MQRRSFVFTLGAFGLSGGGLAACGGGGDEAPGPGTLPTTTVGTLAVSNHAAVSVPDGGVLIIGGDRGGRTLSDAVDRFDPVTRRITRIATLASGRESHTAVALPDGRVLLAGGTTSLDLAPGSELVDPVRGEVVDAGRLSFSRHGHAMTLLGDGRVLVTGGLGRDSAELWSPAEGWRLLPSRMQHARLGHSATLLADGQVLIAGGDAAGRTDYTFAERFDPRLQTFTPLATGITEQRLLHAAWRARDGQVFIVGGELPGGRAVVPVAGAWRYDPAASRFTPVAGLAVARTLAALVVGTDDEALLIGGQTADGAATGRLSRWSPTRGERGVAELATGRVWHTATGLADGQVLVVGGEDGRGRFVGEVLLVG
ncbi:MAG: hypothetical protein KF891_19735 [Rhizobacter sp.]|nr:hypothetical protein [Rhizobacter sp.]